MKIKNSCKFPLNCDGLIVLINNSQIIGKNKFFYYFTIIPRNKR